MKKTTLNFLLLLFAVTVMVLAIWGPEAISGYRDKSVLNEIHVKDPGMMWHWYSWTYGGGRPDNTDKPGSYKLTRTEKKPDTVK